MSVRRIVIKQLNDWYEPTICADYVFPEDGELLIKFNQDEATFYFSYVNLDKTIIIKKHFANIQSVIYYSSDGKSHSYLPKGI